jgi:ribosomal protein S25
MTLRDEAVGLLPTKAARLAALATLGLATAASLAPHFLSPLLPKTTEAEIVLAQILLPTLTLLLGSWVVFWIVLKELAIQAAATKNKQKPTKAEPPLPGELGKALLHHVALKTSVTVFELCTATKARQSVAELHLHDMQEHGFVSQILSWEGATYWRIEPEGTRYLIAQGLIPAA